MSTISKRMALISGLSVVGAVYSVWGRGSALQPFVMAGFLAVFLVIGISGGWPILRRVRIELALATLAVLAITVSAFVVDGTSRFQKPLLILLTVVTAALITTGLFRIIPGIRRGLKTK